MGAHSGLIAAVAKRRTPSPPYLDPTHSPIPSPPLPNRNHPPEMFPPATADSSNEDPTTQVTFGGRRTSFHKNSPRPDFNRLPSSSGNPSHDPTRSAEVGDGGKKKLSLGGLIALTISMAGAQIAWTVELGYGTPFLLDLGLSEQLTSLVWLAGPISGLVAQPVIGAISDSNTTEYRRRFWIVSSTVVLVAAAVALAYAEAFAAVLVDIFGNNEGRWDEHWKQQAKSTAIGIAVIAFYFLDFALNALQASLRNLLLDITPAEQLGKANAWHGRMTHAGNIIGFGFGFLDLAGWKILRPIGGNQFRKVCIVAMLILVVTVWVTCVTQHEKARGEVHQSEEGQMAEVLKNIVRAVGTLPRPVRRVCYVQVCAFMGWFPFLFYSTTWVGEIMAVEINADPTVEEATRAGEFALLIYSVVAVVAGTVLPYLAARDARLLRQLDEGEAAQMEEDDAVDAELRKIREMVKQWKIEAARQGKPLRLPTMPFMLRNIWTAALALFGIVMMSTFFIRTVFQATVAISILGICWAVACWVPFSIIMEFLKEMDENAATHRKEAARQSRHSSVGPARNRPINARVASTPNMNAWDIRDTEHTPLIRRHSLAGRSMLEYEAEGEQLDSGPQPVAGGTILGIHNLAIVFPQFLIAIISSIIFKLADQSQKAANPDAPDYVYFGKSGVSWVMRFGGVCAFVGAAIARRVPPTKTEKEMRARLAEMRENEEYERA